MNTKVEDGMGEGGGLGLENGRRGEYVGGTDARWVYPDGNCHTTHAIWMVPPSISPSELWRWKLALHLILSWQTHATHTCIRVISVGQCSTGWILVQSVKERDRYNYKNRCK